MGFEPGWGNTAARVQETLAILDELIDSPIPRLWKHSFPAMVFRIVLVSPRLVWARGSLGRPDTGGQVVYVLDQAKSLEKQLPRWLGWMYWVLSREVIILTLIPNSDGTFVTNVWKSPRKMPGFCGCLCGNSIKT